jgi:hypothetical protein
VVALGCLGLMVLPLIGLALGGYVAGQHGAIWGAFAGFAIAAAGCAVSSFGLIKASRRR